MTSGSMRMGEWVVGGGRRVISLLAPRLDCGEPLMTINKSY